MKLPDGLQGMTDAEVQACLEKVEEYIDPAYECIEVIDDLIQTMVEMHEKDIPIPYKMYQDAVQLKYDMVVRIIELKQLPKFVIPKED